MRPNVGPADPTGAEWDKKDHAALSIMWARMLKSSRSVTKGETSGKIVYEKLRAKHEKSTWSRRVAIRDAFHRVTHDTSKPIDYYVRAVTELKDQLIALGEVVSDLYFKDVLLANLDPTYESIRNSLLAQPAGESDLTAILSVVSGATYIQLDIKSAANDLLESQIKREPTEDAMAIRFGKKKGGSWRDRKENPYGKSGSIAASSKKGVHFETSDGAESSGLEDNLGRRWCDPTNEDHCHRCGRRGHISARCIHDMPPDVVKWVMAHPRASERSHITDPEEVSTYVRFSNSPHHERSFHSQPHSPGSHSLSSVDSDDLNSS